MGTVVLLPVYLYSGTTGTRCPPGHADGELRRTWPHDDGGGVHIFFGEAVLMMELPRRHSTPLGGGPVRTH